MKRFSAAISLKIMIFYICKKDTARVACVHEYNAITVHGVASYWKIVNNSPHFSDFFKLKITIRIS